MLRKFMSLHKNIENVHVCPYIKNIENVCPYIKILKIYVLALKY